MKQTLPPENQHQDTARNSSSAGRRSRKKTTFDHVFDIIIQYRNSRLFRWVHNHPGLAMAIVALWGMLIIIMFILFVMIRMVPA